MNNGILNDFIQKIRQHIEILSMEVSKTQIDTEEALCKIKETRDDLKHLNNLLEIEETLSK